MYANGKYKTNEIIREIEAYAYKSDKFEIPESENVPVGNSANMKDAIRNASPEVLGNLDVKKLLEQHSVKHLVQHYESLDHRMLRKVFTESNTRIQAKITSFMEAISMTSAVKKLDRGESFIEDGKKYSVVKTIVIDELDENNDIVKNIKTEEFSSVDELEEMLNEFIKG
jgi:hypothetical protein